MHGVSRQSESVLMDVYVNIDTEDVYGNPCYGDHTYERINLGDGTYRTYNGPCTCAIVPVGIVTSVRRFAVRTTSSNLDDMPF